MNTLIRKFNWPVVGIGLAAVVMFAPTLARLQNIGWQSADYDHAIFILPIALWLIWRQRERLQVSDRIPLSGLLIFAAGVLAYIYAATNAFMFLEAGAFVAVVWGAFRLRVTRESFGAILFPLSYLLFLIPPPGLVIDSLTFPLKQIAAQGSSLVLGMFGLPVQLYGVVLRVGEQELFIADACSGFRSLVALLALGSLLVYFADTTRGRKWLLFLSIVPLAIGANVLRIALTGWIAHQWGSEAAEGFFHGVSGLILFFGTSLGLIGLIRVAK